MGKVAKLTNESQGKALVKHGGFSVVCYTINNMLL